MSVSLQVPLPKGVTETQKEIHTPAGETSCEKPNPSSRAATVAAFHAVTLYTISDAFDMCWQETAAVGFRLDTIFASLLDFPSFEIPWAVRREMLDGSYSALLARRQEQDQVRRGAQKFDTKVLHASVEEWTEILLLPVFHSFQLPPIAESKMHFEMLHLLRELGVGDPKNPRPAMYLPTDLRLRIISRNFNPVGPSATGGSTTKKGR